ncbi:hypothetical protein VP01_2788g1 [Puccinia sorghi]|uniref:Uncharacterized protein n=1 Tax=Puccinia sorghi TaxID=27349 RepID=A0A0L6V4G1_9BASI|nr:hypothetical protein VP01_2788g1 [Puccinia sorghi]
MEGFVQETEETDDLVLSLIILPQHWVSQRVQLDFMDRIDDYGHHFMTLIFFFNVMITFRMWIKALLVSLHQFLNPSPLELAWNSKQISSAIQSSFFPPWKMSHSHCHFPLNLSSNLPRPLETPSSCSWHLVIITYGGKSWLKGRLTALSTIVGTESQHALHNQTYFTTWLFLKALFNQFTPPQKGRQFHCYTQETTLKHGLYKLVTSASESPRQRPLLVLIMSNSQVRAMFLSRKHTIIASHFGVKLQPSSPSQGVDTSQETLMNPNEPLDHSKYKSKFLIVLVVFFFLQTNSKHHYVLNCPSQYYHRQTSKIIIISYPSNSLLCQIPTCYKILFSATLGMPWFKVKKRPHVAEKSISIVPYSCSLVLYCIYIVFCVFFLFNLSYFSFSKLFVSFLQSIRNNFHQI